MTPNILRQIKTRYKTWDRGKGKTGDLFIPRDRSTNTGDLVCGNSHPGPGAADEKSGIDLAFCDGLAHFFCVVGVVDRFCRYGAKILEINAEFVESSLNVLLLVVAGVIGGQSYFHRFDSSHFVPVGKIWVQEG